jgi:glycosyltransferase involved in cell wall biosynthesis
MVELDVLVDLSPHDTSRRFGGTGRYVRELGLALAALSDAERRGLRIGALTWHTGDDVVGPLDWAGHEEVRMTDAHEARMLMERRLLLPLTLRRLRPRLYHQTMSLGTPRGSAVPRVVTCLDLLKLVLHEEYMPGRWAYRRLMHAVEALRFHGAHRVQAISQHTADDLVRVLGVPASKIDVVLLGVDLDRYRLPRDEAEAEAARATRRRYGLTDEGYVFYVGRADPRKSVDVLVAAFARARVPDLELLLIGDMRPSDQLACERAIAAAGNPPGVRMLGFVPEADLPAIMAGALGFVFCSTYEGFGNVPVEAMACGCPVICTGVTSMKETVGDAGLLIPPRDVEATADAIARLARDGALRRQLRDAGIARAARFSWRNTALATVESYERALAG